MIAMPSEAPGYASLPAYRRENCPHCDAVVWHRLSRVEPMSWTELDFLAEHEVDLGRRIIKAKPDTAAERFDKLNRGIAA
jgi:hypothetical protein